MSNSEIVRTSPGDVDTLIRLFESLCGQEEPEIIRNRPKSTLNRSNAIKYPRLPEEVDETEFSRVESAEAKSEESMGLRKVDVTLSTEIPLVNHGNGQNLASESPKNGHENQVECTYVPDSPHPDDRLYGFEPINYLVKSRELKQGDSGHMSDQVTQDGSTSDPTSTTHHLVDPILATRQPGETIMPYREAELVLKDSYIPQDLLESYRNNPEKRRMFLNRLRSQESVDLIEQEVQACQGDMTKVLAKMMVKTALVDLK